MAISINGTTGINNATWSTAGRPTSPATGQTGYNTTLNAYETYNGSGWTVTASWTTANRPVTPAAGYSGYNSTLGAFEFYNGTSWISVNTTSLSYTGTYLIVAGGGSGGYSIGCGGGGGAGGYLTGTTTLTTGTVYTEIGRAHV